ncbi:class I SAM-dependent methyltransferase [Brachybacterium sacelli]|uniref:SAM-dependent methyltransferase n=1 Tax=Brachybacterium sacelli TaxID=173364 RepID=A0ABS4WX25_9MICO|nr:class I SAM-dependent methyltransferase [Brachybacterium sacelli]MBP2380755.1 SAM-dependent methyltransferase [Brachybacterium sacelli]
MSIPLGGARPQSSSDPLGASSQDAATGGPAENLWTAAVRRNPEHAHGYAERWRRIEASGQDIYGEARLLDAMAPRGARILDAGCGSGRLGGHLARAGHHVIGVDLDPHLIDVARQDHPEARWEVANLAELDLRDEEGRRVQFDLALSAGNVFTFLAGTERRPALAHLAQHLRPEGRLVAGFGLDRGYDLPAFEADAAAGGLRLTQRFSTWDLRPASEDFLVGILELA